jgi:hypothetical protein
LAGDLTDLGGAADVDDAPGRSRYAATFLEQELGRLDDRLGVKPRASPVMNNVNDRDKSCLGDAP